MTDLLVFQLAGQQYGLPVLDVAEVVPRASLTPLPGAPRDIIGMLRLRGALLPVVDLRTSLGLPVCSPRLGQCIIATHAASARVGLLVDDVGGLVPASATADNPDTDDAAGPFVRSVQETAGHLVSILNLEATLGNNVRGYLAAIGGQARQIGPGERAAA